MEIPLTDSNTRTVQAESFKFASVLCDQGSIFCIDLIVPGFVDYSHTHPKFSAVAVLVSSEGR